MYYVFNFMIHIREFKYINILNYNILTMKIILCCFLVKIMLFFILKISIIIILKYLPSVKSKN
jgi:hypothetical protein